MKSVKMLVAGECGLVIEFGDTIDPRINYYVHRLAKALINSNRKGLLEVIPTYRSLFVYFDPLELPRIELIQYAQAIIKTLEDNGDKNKTRTIHIPVCYTGEFAPDIDFVAQYNGLSVEEVVSIHTAASYLVYMLGFTPGFPYLGGMSEKIATPRLEKPRTRIPAGSVGIAGSQTGFYPIESPGGWRLIGRTPIKAFNPEYLEPFLFSAGDYLKFFAVSQSEYCSIEKDVTNGAYVPFIETYSSIGEAK